MEVTINQRFVVPERSGTILVQGTDIWTLGAESGRLLRYSGTHDTDLRPVAPAPTVSDKDLALCWDGARLIAADRTECTISELDPTDGRQTLISELKSLDFGEYSPDILSGHAVIGDIAWRDGVLYVAVQAGYSSAIYGIDLGAGRVVSHRFAPGPKPSGIDFDPVDGSLHVIDSRNRELRRFSDSEKVDVAELPSEWVEPNGLSIAPDRSLWSTDISTGDVLRLRVED